jgi:3-hydroxyisobutyrate dehydrogenase
VRYAPDSGPGAPRIGIVGLGRMGTPMCANLTKAGYPVTANDIRPERREAARACGARWSADARELAMDADVLITVLPGPQEVRDVMLGPGGLVDALSAGAAWIDLTSNAPAVVEPIRDRATARGIDVLEAPVGGGIPAAKAGTLQLFVGGEAKVFGRLLPILETLADPDRISHVGGHGAGYTAKLLVNLLWFGQAVATAEALLLGQRAGIDVRTLQQVIAGSAASSDFIRRDLEALFSGNYLRTFGLDRVHEELSAITAMAREAGTPFELGDLVARTYERALTRYGAVDGELLAVALLEEEAGQRLRSG